MKMESRVRSLDKVYKRRDRYDIPDYQREEVWDQDRERTLIDSILQGWHLPKFYFVKVEGMDDSFEVVDGQQRLVTIWSFFDNQLELSDETAGRFDGARYYHQLPSAASDAFDDFEIQFEEISDVSDEEQRELFQRLQLGMSLTA